ncbi:MAG: PQQ-like beta-propeller repeat protein [Acidimicrobiia bacterium]|nr:PQQ-like beta-propeller repeat protein [Acidimicrobiia bacterium]
MLGVPDLDLHWPAETFTDRPFVLDWSDDSRLLLIGSEAGGQEPALLSALDAETGAVLSQIVLDLDPAAVDLAADGRTVAIVFKSGLVAIIDLTSGIAELQLDESRFVSRPVRAWIVLDGTVLAVAQLDGTLLLLDPETGEAHFPSVQNTGAALDVDSAGEEIRLVTADGVLQRLEPGQAGATTASVPLPPRAVEYERSTFVCFFFLGPNVIYTIGPSTGGRVFIINAELGIDILDLSQPGAIMRQLPGPRGRVSYTYVGLPGEHIGHLVGDSAYVVYDANGDLVSEKSLGADLEHPSTVFDIAANERGDVALIGREAPPSEGSAISQLPAKGTDHVYLVEGISGDHDRVALPRGVLTTVVRVDNDGAAIVGLADGRIARVGRDRTIEYTTVAEPGIAVRTLDVRVDGTIVAVDAQGTMWLVDKVGVGSITTAATGVEDVRALGWADQVVTTDALGSMRLWDLTSGAQLALLRKGPGNTDAVAVIDDEARRVWVPGDRSLEAQSTDPAEWAAVLCQRTNRTLTPAERATHIPPGLRDEPNSSACRPPGSSDDTETKPLDKETNP